MKVALVGNPGARSGSRLEDVARELAEAGGDVRRHTPDDGEGLPAALREAMRGAKRVVVAGGDGTVRTAVEQLVGSDATLAVVPLGTHNNFARSLRIPVDPLEAARLAVQGSAGPVDVGRVGDGHFANAVTVGLSTRVARQTGSGLKRWLGGAAYGITALRTLASAEPFDCTLRTRDQETQLRTHQLIIANGRALGPAVAAPHATARDGMLDITALGDGTRRSLLAAWLALAQGRSARRHGALHLRAAEVRVETDPVLALDIDGEIEGRTPAVFGVAPRALRVVAP